MRIVAGQVRSQKVLSGLADEVKDIDWDEWELSTALPYAVMDDKPQREETLRKEDFCWIQGTVDQPWQEGAVYT